jgi:hypothetical protein
MGDLIVTKMVVWKIKMNEWLSLTPNGFSVKSLQLQVTIWWDDEVCFVLDQPANMDF